ncbi:four-carbon acid sugar kinase family protein [Ectobacillus ponti]|uniref:Hydroxyacid dehydrogenase n=1 Tax=Ectobacillus ponti TaxID=2961894 RepID=A0AA41X7E6_9BACI|nr:four-carbon acid sugar kinase family protein [Ectobacillus ponti]MCP8967673.1 hydroxyacid dehydrogenase [Ectobacillus ponti]
MASFTLSSLEGLPRAAAEPGLRESISQQLQEMNHKLIVLDDDPTGVQTVHDIFVITDWGKDWIRKAMSDDRSVFYILTNTRSCTEAAAERINREIVRNVAAVAGELGISFSLISRSDSTLRGHYPLEVDVLADELGRLGEAADGHFIIPAFLEGDRYTVGNTHYLGMDDKLVPVNETEFAKDAVFGYQHADLAKWVEEKTEGRTPAKAVLSISLEDIRDGGVERVHEKIMAAAQNAPIIINAVSYYDLDIVSLAILQALRDGKHYLFRTAASIVKSLAGIGDRPYVTGDEMIAGDGMSNGGLIVVGSHTKKTTEQLQYVCKQQPLKQLELSAAKVLQETTRDAEIQRVCHLADQYISAGCDTLVYTSRDVILVPGKEENLKVSHLISSALVDVVKSLQVKPSYMIAKGGITSSDVATEGLGIKYAKILGQAVAGVPVWLTGSEAKFPNTPYIVFPGNVGQTHSIAQVVATIKSSQRGEV